MTTHRFTPTIWYNTLGSHPAALTVESGDTVVTETLDAFGTDKDGVRRAAEPNPMNGPIAVAGAEPGDALLVEILDMVPIAPTGWTRPMLAVNVVDPIFARDVLKPGERTYWTIERNARTARLAEPPAVLESFDLPLEPIDRRLHLAALRRVGQDVPLLSFDIRQAQAARALGITVLGA